jgi:hypothetical protein
MEVKVGCVQKEAEQEAGRRRANWDGRVGHDVVARRVFGVQG